MKYLSTVTLLFFAFSGFTQIWIDRSFDIETSFDVTYGQSIDFANNLSELKLDISVPVNDSPSSCGRPLMMIVHGGSWLAGDKNEGYPKSLREDFAKRGFVSVSANYRLGQLHTEKAVNCNVPEWNCFNMTDPSEWYRANHRGIQDVHGAIRYMLQNVEAYNINADNVFIVGESAGAFISLGVAYIDNEAEVKLQQTEDLGDALLPNSLYEQNCIINYNLAEDLGSINPSRPTLGNYHGDLNVFSPAYTIQAVGAFYGGVHNNIFKDYSGHLPALYMFHQPCDLIVDIDKGKVLKGYNNCLAEFPANCGNIINRPTVLGSRSIKVMLDSMASESIPIPDYIYEESNNNWNCLQQAGDPALVCHAIDNYNLRTENMATFFAEKVVSCTVGVDTEIANDIRVMPIPAFDQLTIKFGEYHSGGSITLVDLMGNSVLESRLVSDRQAHLSITTLEAGVYIIIIKVEGTTVLKKIIKQ